MTGIRFFCSLIVLISLGVSAGSYSKKSTWQETLLAVRAGLKHDANPKELADLHNRLMADFPVEQDWFTQDADRLNIDPKTKAPRNLIAYLKTKRDASLEKSLIKRATAGVTLSRKHKDIVDQQLASAKGAGDRSWLDVYITVCRARRKQRLKSLRAQYPKIGFIKRRPIRPSFFAYTEGQSDAQRERHFLANAKLCVLDMSSNDMKVTNLLEDKVGCIRDLDVSYDGKQLLFAWKKSDRKDDYHLYEMDVATKKIRQITKGLGVADYEGRYLPNGDLIFASSRCVQTVDCWWTEVSNLYTCDKNGQYLRRLGFDQVHTIYPSVLDSGLVVYTRWDYNDRGQVFPQPLFQMNPDGTGQTEFYGNNSFFPTTIAHARGLPGSDKLVVVLHGHHTWQAGQLAIIDRSKGTQENKGVQLIAPVRETKAVRVDTYGQREEMFRHPYPISDREFIVSMTPVPGDRRRNKSKFGIYWIDIDGHRELLAYDADISCNHPIPIAPRKRPAVRPSTVDYRKKTGTYFVQDVYYGPGSKGIKRGSIKKLRVVSLDFRAAGVGNNGSRGEAGGALVSTPISLGNGSWDIKEIIGEATVYEDGSAMFEAPANTPLYFQLIDDQGCVAQTMRSWSTLMPGETFGCVGCHENKYETPVTRKKTIAMRKGVKKLVPLHEVEGGFSFVKNIQPILDKHCISCHDGKKKSKKGKLLGNLTSTRRIDNGAKRKWTESYLYLLGVKPGKRGRLQGNDKSPVLNWISSQSRPTMLPPYFRGSAKSKVVQLMRKGHGKAKVDPDELDVFCAWIDLCVPFCGDYIEGNAWSKKEFDYYMRYQRKRERLADQDRQNIEELIKKQTGESFKLKPTPPRYTDYAINLPVQKAPIPVQKHAPIGDWKPGKGKWTVKDAIIRNSSTATGCLILGPGVKWQDYTFTCKARRTGGREGLMLIFRAQSENSYYNWHFGAWGNKRQAIQRNMSGKSSKSGTAQNNQWYDVRIELKGKTVKCYIDDKLELASDNIDNKTGGIGFGAWGTKVEYKDVLVKAPDGKVLFKSK